MRREGTSIGQFRIDRLLGHGGMGAVYVAVDEMTGREVAVKLLRPDLLYDAGFVDRFKAEARTLARLDHPRIARLHGFFREEDDLLMVMEFVRGTTLADLLRAGGAVSPQTAVSWVLDVLEALHYAHAMGIVHRDVKPANIIIEEQTGRARLTDFGIARSEAEGRLTQTGQTVGTIAYMSPEQLTTTELDGRADLYAVGVVLFEMLTGSIPYTATTTFTLMREVAEGVPAQAIDRVPDAAAPVRDVLRRALATAPAERFADGHTFAAALRAAWSGAELPAGDLRSTTAATIVSQPAAEVQAPRRWQPAALAGAGLLALLIGAGAVWTSGWMRTPPASSAPVPLPSASEASEPAPADAAAVDPPLPNSDAPTPPAAATTSTAAAGAPVAQQVPSASSASVHRQADETSSVQAAAEPAPPPAVTPVRPALPPQEFGRALLMVDVTEDGETETEEVDVLLRFDGQRLLVLNAETRMPMTRAAYDAIRSATYTPEQTRIALFRGIAHWLHVQAGGDHIVLRLDKRNFSEIVDELESRMGKRVLRAAPR